MERVKQGCPLNSIRAADHWLEHRKLKRAPTTGPNVCKFAVGETEPLEPIDGVKRRGRQGTAKQPSRSSDSLRDALDNAITVQERAFIQVDKAIINGASSMSALLHVHTKALEARFMAEKAYREEMERRGLLIDKQKVTDLCRRAMDAVLRRLKKLPGERGPECNPENAIMGSWHFDCGSELNYCHWQESFRYSRILKATRKSGLPFRSSGLRCGRSHLSTG